MARGFSKKKTACWRGSGEVFKGRYKRFGETKRKRSIEEGWSSELRGGFRFKERMGEA